VQELTENFAAADPEAKPEIEQNIAKAKAEAAALDAKLVPGGCPDIAQAQAQVAVAEARGLLRTSTTPTLNHKP